MIITIDGPSGTGKSTVARGVAKQLGFTFFDTGAMYRSFAWLVLQKGIDPADEAKVAEILPEFRFEIRPTPSGDRHYFVLGSDVTQEIRTQPISMASSQIAVYSQVREAMVQIQRAFGYSVNAVFEGRDMGTVVFPDADLKIFLTAKPQVRAERRYRELLHKFPDLSMTEGEILKQIEERDKTDSTRVLSPLKQAPDAILIDTSDLSANQVIEKIVAMKPKSCIPRMKPLYWFCRFLVSLFYRCFHRLKVYGAEHICPGGAIIAPNHTSFYDPPIIAAGCPEEVNFLAKASLFNIPLLGMIIRRLNAHPVYRTASDGQTLKMMIDLLSTGKKLVLFPEGQRSFTGELLPLERGIAFLVQKAQCKLIPAYIHGAYDVWPRLRKLPKLFGRIVVVFGSPLEWDNSLDKKEAQTKLMTQTEKSIRELKAWLEDGAQGKPP